MNKDAKSTRKRFPGKKGGWSIGMDHIECVAEMIKDMGTYIEIGVLDGIGLSILAEKYPNKQFYGLDVLQPNPTWVHGMLGYIIDNNKHLDNVNMFVGNSENNKIPEGVTFDFGLIDGDHSYEWVVKDFQWLYPKMNNNGIIAFHDYTAPDVKKAADLMCGHVGATLKREPHFHYIEVSK